MPLITSPSVFSLGQPDGMPDYVWRVIALGVVVLAVKVALDAFFSTHMGLALRATGSNPRMSRAQCVATGAMVLVGMALSNGLVSLAGALFVQM